MGFRGAGVICFCRRNFGSFAQDFFLGGFPCLEIFFFIEFQVHTSDV